MTNEGAGELTVTPAEIAAYLMQQLEEHGIVYQREFVEDVEERFGERFVYINENGNPAVARSVYTAFAKLKAEHPREIEWDRWSFCWALGDPKAADTTE